MNNTEYKIINLEQGTKEWLEYRKSHKNASEIGNVMGYGFIKPYELALIKFHDKKQFINKNMILGNKNEKQGRDYLNSQGFNFKPFILEWIADPTYSCSLDGFDIEKNIICEIKFSRNEHDYLKEYKKPSDKYYYQIQQQLMISRAEKCIYCVIALNDNFDYEYLTIEISPNKSDFVKIRTAWDKFYQDYSNSINDDEFLELAMKLTDLSIKKSELEKEITELKQKAIAKANGKEIKVNNITIFKTLNKGSFDYKGYCEANAIIPNESFRKEPKETWSIRVNF